MIRRTYPGERRGSKDSKLTPRQIQQDEFGQPPKLTPRETEFEEVGPRQTQHEEIGPNHKQTPRQIQHQELGQPRKLTPRQAVSAHEKVGQHPQLTPRETQLDEVGPLQTQHQEEIKTRKLTPRQTQRFEVVGPPRLTPRQTQHGEVGQHRNLTPRQSQHAEVGQSLKLTPRQVQQEEVAQARKPIPQQTQHDELGQSPNLVDGEFVNPDRNSRENRHEPNVPRDFDYPNRDSTGNLHEHDHQTFQIRPYRDIHGNRTQANGHSHEKPHRDNKENRTQPNQQPRSVKSPEKAAKVRALPSFAANEKRQTFSTVSEDSAEVAGGHLHELTNLAIGGKAGLSFAKRNRGQRKSAGAQVYGLQRCRAGAAQEKTVHESFAMDLTVEASQTLSDISRLMENRLNPSLEPTYEPDSHGRSKASYFSNHGRDARSHANESFSGQPFTNSVILEDTNSAASMSPESLPPDRSPMESSPVDRVPQRRETWTMQPAPPDRGPMESSPSDRVSPRRETWTMRSARRNANRSLESSTASAATETWTLQSARKIANTSMASSTDGDDACSGPIRLQGPTDHEIERSEESSSFPDNRTSDDSPEVPHRLAGNRDWSPSPSQFRASPAKPPRSLSRPIASPLSLDHFPTQRSPTPLTEPSNPSLSPEMQGERAAGLGLRVRPSGGNGGLWVVGAVPDGPVGRVGLERGDVIMWASLGVTGSKTTGEDVGDLINRQGSNFSMLVGRGRRAGSLASMQLVRLTLHRRDVRYGDEDGDGREEPVGMVVADGKGGKPPSVARIVEGGAADLAGVRVGDVVVGIGVEKVGVHSMSSLLGQQGSWILLGVRQKNSDKSALQHTGVDQNGVAWVRVERELGMPVLLQRKAEIKAKDTSLSIASVQPSTTPLPSVSPASLLGTPASLRFGGSPGDSIRILHSDFEPIDLISSGSTPRKAAAGRRVPSPRSSKKGSPIRAVPAMGSTANSHSPRVLAHTSRVGLAAAPPGAGSPLTRQRPASPQASKPTVAEPAEETRATTPRESWPRTEDVALKEAPAATTSVKQPEESTCTAVAAGAPAKVLVPVALPTKPLATTSLKDSLVGWGTLPGSQKATPRSRERVRRWSSGGGSFTRSDLNRTAASSRRQSGSGQGGTKFPWEKVQWLGLDGKALEEAAWSYVREKDGTGKEGRVTPRGEGRVTPRGDAEGRITPRQSLGRAASSGRAAKALALQQKQEPPEMLDARCVAERTGVSLDVALFMLRRNGMDVVETILSMSVYGQNNGIFA